MSILRPKIKVLDKEHKELIFNEAIEILEKQGVFVNNNEAIKILKDEDIEIKNERFFLTRHIIEKAIKTCRKEIKLYDREAKDYLKLSGDNIHFDPGSAAIYIMDENSGEIRLAQSQDFIKFSKIMNHLDYIDAQSTSMLYEDVPMDVQDWHRLYIALKYCYKPIITGTFRKESFSIMKELLLTCRSSERELADKPLAIFDACPSPPLKWSDLTVQSVIDAAKSMIPVEFVSMPLAGANAPITLIGSITQHCAETLSGLVIAQLVNKGAPVIWGGSPSIMDMRKGTTPMGAIETMMIDLGDTEMGKFLGLPTHAYMGLSDSKTLDSQSGLESSLGAILAALGGINMVSGLGMMNFESTQSLEKLIIDNEIAGMVKRLVKGISDYGKPYAFDILSDYNKTEELLSHSSTLKLYKKELLFPSSIIDRNTLENWKSQGSQTARARARDLSKTLEEKPIPRELDENTSRELDKVVSHHLN